jgi:ubiquinone/menaquinone biosynthesis C-methylase UbiE
VRPTKTAKLIARFLRFFFKLLYTDLSWAYDTVAWLSSIGQWRSWQRIGLKPLTPGSTLEIGFGTGHMLTEMSGASNLIVGVDASYQMARIAHKRLTNAMIPALLAQASSFNLPFSRSTFSNVLSTFPSEFIYAPETFEEILRVLEPGGRLVVVPGVLAITGPRTGNFSILRIMDKIAAWLYSFTGEQISGSPDWREDLESELLQMGFQAEIESVTTTRATVLRLVAEKKRE